MPTTSSIVLEQIGVFTTGFKAGLNIWVLFNSPCKPFHREETEGQRSPLAHPTTHIATDSRNRAKASSSPAGAFPLPTAASLDIQNRWMIPRTVVEGVQAPGLEPVQGDRGKVIVRA